MHRWLSDYADIHTKAWVWWVSLKKKKAAPRAALLSFACSNSLVLDLLKPKWSLWNPRWRGRCGERQVHSVLTLLENKNTSDRTLFVDFSSAFNTIFTNRKTSLWARGQHSTTGYWTSSQTDSSQLGLAVKPPPLWHWTPSPSPSAWVLTLMFTLRTHDCTPRHQGMRYTLCCVLF